MKTIKLLIISIITLLSAFLSSCDKEDLSEHSLDNTYWVSPLHPNALIGYALSFNNGYMQRLYLDKVTGTLSGIDFTAKYSVKGEKIIITIDNVPSRTPETYEATYKKGIIYFSGIDYYLQ